jgi:hypothetical protein
MICLMAVAASVGADGSRYARTSALAEGKWVKVSISETGFYKLTYADLKKMGFASPEKVSVHGYGGYPLEEDFSKAVYIDDVPSIPVYRGADYILFFGKGAVKWTYDAAKSLFTHENNAYSTKGYYFVTDATETNDVTITPSVSNTSITIDKFDDYMLHEVDRVSLTNAGRPNSGRELFGESFDVTSSRDFTFNIPGITGDEGRLSYRFVAKVLSGTGIVSVSIDGSELTRGSIPQNNYMYTAALSASAEVAWKGDKSENTTVKVAFNLTGQVSHLDYIRLQMTRTLQPYGATTLFRSLESINKASQFTIKNASSNVLVFDVTDGMTQMEIATEGSNATFSIPSGSLREFAMADLSKTFPVPETVGEVKPQNLHGMPQTHMVILAPEAFMQEAERLAQVHRQRDNLTVAVVKPEDVYNEFSSGAPEATAVRRFMKMFYDRRTSDDDAPRYLLLFGDGRWDNRKLSDQWKSSSDNYIITYQTRESIAEDSYVTDDYFGFLADNQGADIVAADMHIGIGRFPVNTLAQAKNAVDKTINYIENNAKGAWKNKICFVADDGNRNDTDPTIHAQQADTLARYIESSHPAYIPKKLYFDAFKISYSGGKPTYPDIRTNLQKELKEGMLILNYTGHGDAESWSEEKVVTQADINSYSYTNLPLWITASCVFAPFDAPSTSAGENVFLNPKSGGIALFTAARVAYSDANLRLNRIFLSNLFEKQDGRHLALGTIMKNSKNSYKSDMIMSFLLIGDPALTLAYPDDFNMEVTEINGYSVENATVNFKAFEKITVTGRVTDASGRTIDDFNGLLSATVFDSRKQIETLNNTGAGTITYTDYPNKVYACNDSVYGGQFSFSFMMPKDISYSNDYGKISMYAADETNRIEANGSFKDYTVGGTADITVNDETGPEIRAIYLNNSSFTDGDKVNVTPVFAAIVWDESGINTGGSSIGHDITLTIDNSYTLTWSLNSYYETYLSGEDGEGIVRFPLPALEEGSHTAEFKVWDIFNNSSSQTFSFIVSDAYKPSIAAITAAPSPASDFVYFIIEHDMPESQLKVELQVFDLTGRLMWSRIETGSSEMMDSYRVKWDLTNGAGAKLRPGTYVYRAIISSNNSSEVSKSNKLVIKAQ